MVKRDLKDYGEFRSVYEELFKELEDTFKDKTDKLTPFHHILLDRVCDSYVATLKADSKKGDGTATEKGKTAQERLQKWLSMALAELHNAESESVSRKMFYGQFVDVIRDAVTDTIIRQKIFTDIQAVMKRSRLDV